MFSVHTSVCQKVSSISMKFMKFGNGSSWFLGGLFNSRTTANRDRHGVLVHVSDILAIRPNHYNYQQADHLLMFSIYYETLPLTCLNADISYTKQRL